MNFKFIPPYFVLVFLAIPHFASAFPEMVRHGYVNCTACHVSPSGGGVLTDYGRVLSKELLSTWTINKTIDENDSTYAPFRLNLGGDIRVVQTYLDTPAVREGRPILMQTDVEAALSYLNKVYLVATAGIVDKAVTPPDEEYKFISRRHFLNYRHLDKLSFRLGRFYPAYGIYQPNHTLVTRRAIGFDQDRESYNFEAAWLGDNFDVFLTGVFGRPDEKELDREKGISLSSSYSLFETYKVGLSYFGGENNVSYRNLYGIFGILGITERFFVLTEFDYQVLATKGGLSPTQNGFVTYNRVNYEITQGLHAYVPYQVALFDSDSPDTKTESFGLGVQFFPVEHLEISLEWLKQKGPPYPDEFVDVGFVLLHAFL